MSNVMSCMIYEGGCVKLNLVLMMATADIIKFNSWRICGHGQHSNLLGGRLSLV